MGGDARLKSIELVGCLDRVVKSIMETVELRELEKQSITTAQYQPVRGGGSPGKPKARSPVEPVWEPERSLRPAGETQLLHNVRAGDQVSLGGQALIRNELGLVTERIRLFVTRNHQNCVTRCLQRFAGKRN